MELMEYVRCNGLEYICVWQVHKERAKNWLDAKILASLQKRSRIWINQSERVENCLMIPQLAGLHQTTQLIGRHITFGAVLLRWESTECLGSEYGGLRVPGVSELGDVKGSASTQGSCATRTPCPISRERRRERVPATDRSSPSTGRRRERRGQRFWRRSKLIFELIIYDKVCSLNT